MINHFYACKKPFKSKLKLSLDFDENIMDLISAMKKVRPGRRGASVFSSRSSQDVLNSFGFSIFGPPEGTAFHSQK